MNERVMQFRIGMFVIVAGLVLTMLIVWFGESPTLLRDQGYLKARYADAPGVLEGVAVRKSGIRIGEVVKINFDERPNQPDGVIVTLAIERKYAIREGSAPRISRSLIGDVAIDLQPGEGEGQLVLGDTPDSAPIVEGQVAPDPSKALAAATLVFEKAGDTLKTINDAASGLAKLSKSTENLEDFLKTWDKTGKDISAASDGISHFLNGNENDFKATMTNLRSVGERLNNTLTPETQDAIKTSLAKISSASARLDEALAEVSPLMKDLGAPVSNNPTTDVGQVARRMNRVISDLELLTSSLRGKDGTLNTNGTLQKLITQVELYDNLNGVAVGASQTIGQLKPILTSFRSFAERLSRDPSIISRGALQR